MFKALQRESVLKIAGKLLAEVVDRVAQRGTTLRIGSGVAELVAAEGVTADQGARQLRRAVTSLVEDPLTDRLLQEEPGTVGEVAAEVVAGRLVLTLTHRPVSPVKSGQGIHVPGLSFMSPVFSGRRSTMKANA